MTWRLEGEEGVPGNRPLRSKVLSLCLRKLSLLCAEHFKIYTYTLLNDFHMFLKSLFLREKLLNEKIFLLILNRKMMICFIPTHYTQNMSSEFDLYQLSIHTKIYQLKNISWEIYQLNNESKLIEVAKNNVKVSKYSSHLKHNELKVKALRIEKRKDNRKWCVVEKGLWKSYILETASFFLHHFLHDFFNVLWAYSFPKFKFNLKIKS